MNSVMDQPRTITVRGTPMRFANFGALADLATLQLEVLKDAEAKIPEGNVASAEQWSSVAGAAEFLADLCSAQDVWLAEHDAQLAAEAEAIRAVIREI